MDDNEVRWSVKLIDMHGSFRGTVMVSCSSKDKT